MDVKKKFDGLAKEYTNSRPGYASELIDYLYRGCAITAHSVIADIGSGTGKFAKQLLDKGSTVYCIEPNTDMRCVAEKELGTYKNFHSVVADAEHTTLGNCSVDFITAAQAFHWFDAVKFKQECNRILKPGGKVFLIWNIRNEHEPLNSEWSSVFKEYCPDFRGFNGGIKRDDERIKEFFNNGYEFISFDNPLYFNKEKFISRSLSGSYSLKQNDDNYNLYISKLQALFDKYETDGSVKIDNQTVAYIGSIK